MKGKFIFADFEEKVDRGLGKKRALTEAELLSSLLFSLRSTRLKFSALVCMHLDLLHIFLCQRAYLQALLKIFGHIFIYLSHNIQNIKHNSISVLECTIKSYTSAPTTWQNPTQFSSYPL